jgi:hypothetical protein
MNLYKCFFDRKDVEISANTPYEAQQKAVKHFLLVTRKRVIKTYQVNVSILQINGIDYINSTCF